MIARLGDAVGRVLSVYGRVMECLQMLDHRVLFALEGK